jgi:hypothetical protein
MMLPLLLVGSIIVLAVVVWFVATMIRVPLPIAGFVCVLGVIATFVVSVVRMPGRSFAGAPRPLSADERRTRERIAGHLTHLAVTIGERNMQHYAALDDTRGYITAAFAEMGYCVHQEPLSARGRSVSNIVAAHHGVCGPAVLVGAHYDTVSCSPGANDNGSGVAGLLELARILYGRPEAAPVRFVAFVNEEAPYFGTSAMGSLHHAREAQRRGERITAMLALETIGYYSQRSGSQTYPIPLKWLYPRTGNFIGFVGNMRSRRLVHTAVGAFRNAATIPSEGIAAPELIRDIGRSDHWSFWQIGVPALMVTDTANFRYRQYHGADDTADIIDYDSLTRVVYGLADSVVAIALDTRTQN